jgi:hypothetical protein
MIIKAGRIGMACNEQSFCEVVEVCVSLASYQLCGWLMFTVQFSTSAILIQMHVSGALPIVA